MAGAIGGRGGKRAGRDDGGGISGVVRVGCCMDGVACAGIGGAGWDTRGAAGAACTGARGSGNWAFWQVAVGLALGRDGERGAGATVVGAHPPEREPPLSDGRWWSGETRVAPPATLLPRVPAAAFSVADATLTRGVWVPGCTAPRAPTNRRVPTVRNALPPPMPRRRLLLAFRSSPELPSLSPPPLLLPASSPALLASLSPATCVRSARGDGGSG